MEAGNWVWRFREVTGNNRVGRINFRRLLEVHLEYFTKKEHSE